MPTQDSVPSDGQHHTTDHEEDDNEDKLSGIQILKNTQSEAHLQRQGLEPEYELTRSKEESSARYEGNSSTERGERAPLEPKLKWQKFSRSKAAEYVRDPLSQL